MIKKTLVMVRAEGEGITGDRPVYISALCARCAHLGEGLTCKAFPKGIPEPILNGRADHRKPYLGDGGIRFKDMNR